MGNHKICARCGADIDVVLGGSGSYLCAYCRGAKQSDSLSRYRREAWRRQVEANHKQLDACVADANRLGMSYGEYMATRDLKKLHLPDGDAE